ncbi:DUF1800 family protein [Achromobacter xylosoxidans]
MSCPLLLLPLAAAALAQPPAADPAREAALVNRITWGATPAELARIRELGPERYLQAQLHPAPAPPCRPRSSGASTPCRSRGSRTRMRRPNSAGCARTPRTRRPTPGSRRSGTRA